MRKLTFYIYNIFVSAKNAEVFSEVQDEPAKLMINACVKRRSVQGCTINFDDH